MAKIKKTVQLQMPLIKEIFIYLQGKSKRYPYIDHHTYWEHFLTAAHFNMEQIDKATYGMILSRADHSASQIANNPSSMMCRATFTESLVYLAKYIYCDTVDTKELNGSEFELVGINRALQWLISEKLKTFFLESNIGRQVFREEKLQGDHDTLMVFSINQASI